MSEPRGADEIVTIDGNAYSRLMAEEMVRDIELANEVKPSAWAIDNTALAIGSIVVISFGSPVQHGYLIDLTDASEEVRELVERYGRGKPIPSRPAFARPNLPERERGELLRTLRPAHEAALRKLLAASGLPRSRNWHNDQAARTLAEIVGRELPEPGYAEKLKQSRLNELSKLTKPADFDPRMLEQLARDVEEAHEANPNSWALHRIKPGALALSVESLTVFYIARERGGLTLMGDPNDPAFASIDRAAIQTDYKYFPGFWINAGSVEHLAELVTEFGIQHHDAIVDLARRVKTKTTRANEHQAETLAELSAFVGRELPTPGYALTERASAPPVEQRRASTQSQAAPLDIMLAQFAAAGLSYTRPQLATFYTALQTKGFVILSGISGTGKSKIATGFVQMLPNPFPVVTRRRDGDRFMLVSVKPYMKEHRRIALPTRYYNLLPLMERGESHQLSVSINGKLGTGLLWFGINGGGEQYLLSLHQVLSAEVDAWREGQSIYLDFVLNAEGDKVVEARITSDPPAREGDGELAEAGANHLFLAVRPDWRDSTSLLGYYNPLTQTYEWTEFLRFILRAQASFEANDGLAWFVILDEMNLAHVEHYFADLLSVIESGRDAEGWTREPIRLSYPDALDDEAPPAELKLPPNLYLIGTVNMDETTHAFSPKVLDRAFTIELSEVDFLTYQPARGDSESVLGNGHQQQLLDAFTRLDPETGRRAFARIDKREIAEIVEQEPEIRRFLDALNKRLESHRFHFGYRVFDEIAQYLANSRRNGMMDFGSAFDQAVFMKVLPKFSGSRARLRGPLLSLLGWALNPASPISTIDVQRAFTALDIDDDAADARFIEDAAFPVTARRALQMLIALENDGFVAFG